MQYLLFGNPVSHSLSPVIHQEFAAQFKLQMHYGVQAVDLDDFPAALKQFRAQGGVGANITAPLKSLAYSLCEQSSPIATVAQAVNTLYWNSQGQLCGDNTDGAALVQDLQQNHNQVINHKNILIIGAGGAAAGIIPALLDQAPESISIANRTYARALNVKERILDARLQVLELEQLRHPVEYNFDIIINATSASVHNSLIDIVPSFIQDKVVYDLAYNLEKPTVFVAWAQNHGAKAVYDGLGMLIEQAAQAFYIWHHKRPDTQVVYNKLKKYKKI